MVTQVTATLLDETKELEKNNDTYSGEMVAPSQQGTYSLLATVYDDLGNIVQSSETLEVGYFSTPKTNWTINDRFNIQDYNRIKNNINKLHEMAIMLWKPFNIDDMGEDLSEYTVYWDVDRFNDFENNLEKINKNIYTQDFGATKHYYENGAFIDWQELNRIESATLSMYELLETQAKTIRRLSFVLGQYKEGRF